MSAIAKLAEFSNHFNERIDLESYLYNLLKTRKRNTFFFVCTVDGDGSNFNQRSFHKSEINKALEFIKKNQHKRIFVPTTLFESRERTEDSIGQIRKILIDIDPYKSEKYSSMSPEEVVEDMQVNLFATEKIPTPNVVTYSGGGFYLEYHLQFTPGGNVLLKRRVVAKILYEMLKEYGPDAKSLDAPHVFGLADTTNWKYGKNSVVRSFKNDLPEYSLAGLSRSLPNLWDVWKVNKKIKVEKDIRRPKTSTNSVAKVMPIHKERTLAFDHIVSIKQLIRARDGEMTGYREMAVFFVRNAYHKMHSKRFYEGDETLFEESLQLAFEVNKMFKGRLTEDEITEGTLNTKKLYNFKTDTIVDWFDITMDEQIKMKVKTKTAKNEKSKRQMRELREERGQTREQRIERDKRMIERYFKTNPDASNVQASKDLEISRPTLIKYRKEMNI
ncbi:replication protein [Bacillus sp. AFS001701]|uniref:replication protein n=1 Tax=Bacillus sp. AFS001701 TaxID=2033480 RepID=UPI000BF7877D|nr:replication protein [Bacillus sp. AFS001701]PET75425.1 replication protein [Bacillus sp. AFS001701]